MRHPWYVALLSLVVMLMVVPAAGAQEQGEVRISIRDSFFDPVLITVAPGTTVTWVNEGESQHTVTSDDGQFDSGVLEPGDSFSVAFSGAGALTYHCEIHPSMTASVTVDESVGAATPL